jgi:type 1 fimbria pilin
LKKAWILVLIIVIMVLGMATATASTEMDKVTFDLNGDIEINYCKIVINNSIVELNRNDMSREELLIALELLYDEAKYETDN